MSVFIARQPSRITRWTQSLRGRLILLVMLAAAPAVAFLTYQAIQDQRQQEDAAYGELLMLTRNVAQQHTIVVRSAEALLRTLSRAPAIVAKNWPLCSRYFSALLEGHADYTNIGIVDLSGRAICSGIPASPEVDLGDRRYFRAALQSRGFAIGDYQIGRITGKKSIGFGYPLIEADGTVYAVLFAAYELDAFSRFTGNIDLGKTRHLALLGDNGKVLARHPGTQAPIEERIATRTSDADTSSETNSRIEPVDVEGEPWVAGIAAVYPDAAGNRLHLAVAMPHAALMENVGSRMWEWIGVPFIVLSMVLALAWLGAHAIVLQKIRGLLAATDRLTHGDWSARVPATASDNELNRLALHFNDMAEALGHQRTERERRAHDMQRLAELSIAAGRLASIETLLQFVTDHARELLGAHHATAQLSESSAWSRAVHASSQADSNEAPPDDATAEARIVHAMVCDTNAPLRKTGRVPGLTDEDGAPRFEYGWLAAPLIAQDGCNMGAIRLCRKIAGDFTEYDEAVLVQVAQLASALIQKAASLHQARAAEREYRYLFDKNPNPMWVYDSKTLAFLAVNDAALRHYGYSRAEFLAMTIRDIRPEEDVPALTAVLDKVLAAGASSHQGQWRHRRRGGDLIEVEVTSYPIEFAQRDGRLTLIRDVTESVLTKARLAERDVQLTALLDSTAEGIYGLDPLGRCTFSNAACARMLGYDSSQDLVGRAMHDLVHHTHRDGRPHPMHECAIRRAYLEERPQHADNELMWRRDGTSFPVEYWAYPITKSGTVVGSVVSFFDITERQAYAQTLQHQATHDSLTGLPNRHTLHRTIADTVGAARARHRRVALFLMDLDRFKEVNDTLGHHAGDQLLVQLAERLRSIAGGRDALVRLGGDEFAVVIGQLDSREAAEDKARTLLGHIKAPFDLTGMRVQIGASIGIAMHPDHGDDPGVLLRRADVAMYAAKRDGLGHAVYHEALDFHTPERLTLLSDAHTAIQGNELLLHFQPKMGIATRRVVGFEALVRWRHPRRGLISPGEFIPLIELSDLIRPLTLWVLENAVAECKRWHARGHRLGVGVNISTRNLLDLALPGQVLQLLARHQLDPCFLELEITESAIMADAERAVAVLSELSAAGISIAVDDFGTGYSSLGYLEKLRVRSLKIDRSFVHHMNERDGARNIVTAVIALAHNLGLSVVAEGVESRAILDALGALHCDLAQGYFIAKPMPAGEVAGWLANSGYLI